MKFQRQLKEDDVSVNLTPLIDIVFLLLIFFMVTTTFERESRLLITLPEAEAEQTRAEESPLEITVLQNGHFRINGQALADNSPASLRTALEEAASGSRDRTIVIAADAKSDHQDVVTAMNSAGQLGFNHINIATRRARTQERGQE